MKMALSKAPLLLLLAFLFSVGLLVSARELAEKTASTVEESKYHGDSGHYRHGSYGHFNHHGGHGGGQLPERKLAAEETQVKPEYYHGGHDDCYGHGCHDHGGDSGGHDGCYGHDCHGRGGDGGGHDGCYGHGCHDHGGDGGGGYDHGGYGGGGGNGHGRGGYGGPEVKETAKGN